MDRGKVISLALAVLVFLTALSVASTFFLRRSAAPGTAPSPEAFNGFLFLRDNQIMLFSKDGQISSSSARENITDFAYSKNDKTIYFLRDGDIWQQPLDSTVSAAITKTEGEVTSFSLSPNSKNIAYISHTATQLGKLYLINLETQEASQLLQNIPKVNISLAGWTNRNRPVIRQASESALLSSKYLIFDSDPPSVKEGIGAISWSPTSNLQVIATQPLLPPKSPNQPESKIEVFNSSGVLLSQKSGPGFLRDFAWSSDGKYLAAGFTNTLAWAQIDRLSNWQDITFDDLISAVRFLPDDRIILTVNTKTIYIVNPTTGKYERIIGNGVSPWPL